MVIINQALSSAKSILAHTAVSAAGGAWTCAVGGVVIGAAVPSVATGAIVLGVSRAISRTVIVLGQHIGSTNCGKTETVKFLRNIAEIASLPIGLYAGAAAATALGMPITFKATALLWLGALPTTALTLVAVGGLVIAAVCPVALAVCIYVRVNGIPQFVNNALNEMAQNAQDRQRRDQIINLQRRIDQFALNMQGRRV